MSFLTLDDYKNVIGDVAFRAVSQADPAVVEAAAAEAIEEMAGYLRPTYDTAAIFSAVGADRNRVAVMYAADIALYHMSASLPQKMGAEVRKERYDRAIRWLEGVQAGRIIPGLPRPSDNDMADAFTGSFITFAQSNPHDW